jgi:diguanylate cyclase (GGDEF)-like protein
MTWNRILEIENARLLRYRRPVTIVVADIEGLRRLAERLGEVPVQRLLPLIADAFVREARTSDWIARVGEGRFRALLPETDEIQAINYVERVRIVCEPWLASAAVPLSLAIGWSSPSASSDLMFAIQQAEERMRTDRRTADRLN